MNELILYSCFMAIMVIMAMGPEWLTEPEQKNLSLVRGRRGPGPNVLIAKPVMTSRYVYHHIGLSLPGAFKVCMLR